MRRSTDDTVARAKAAEDAGLLATALNLHRVCYQAARPNSTERRVRMADMLRLRKKGAAGSIPGDRSGDHPSHNKLRRGLESASDNREARLTDVPQFLRRA